ncbi:MAG: alpha/beta fold hydrolase [Cellvibrionaceae bacterium]|nr:alpha/beta fold hydrolase [Cellvibrionaceae bacterium]
MQALCEQFASTTHKLAYDPSGTAYLDEGEGEPIVFIHGVGLSHRMWFAQSQFKSRYRVIRYDLLGHGGSPLLGPEASLLEFTRQLANLLDYLEIRSCSVVGFSLGALIAQEFSLNSGQRVHNLVLMNSVYDRSQKQRVDIYERALDVATNGRSKSINAAIERWFSQGFRQREAALVKAISQELAANDDMSYLRAYTVFAQSDQRLTGRVIDISHNTLVITGELDVGSTPDMSRALHKQIANSTLVIVPEQRHMLPVEGALATNKHLLNFLNRENDHDA